MSIHPCHKEELIKKTEELVSLWNDHISRMNLEGPEFSIEISFRSLGRSSVSSS